MRAFLSTGREREPRLYGASWRDFDGTRSANLLAAEAEGEARRILAEVEASGHGYVTYQSACYGVPLSQGTFIAEAQAALADALRAFCGDCVCSGA